MSKIAIALREHRLVTPIGVTVLLTDANDQLRVLDFEDYADRMVRLLDLNYGPCGWAVTLTRGGESVRDSLQRYFDGEVSAIDNVPTRTGGTPFQREVWTALRVVPAGTAMSYGALARSIQRPKAVRAVGRANGANPIGIVIPCHRIIGGDGSLTGYGGGIERKRWLLAHEARYSRATA